MQRLLGDDVHSSSEQPLQLERKVEKCHRPVVSPPYDKEIDVAVRSCLVSAHRSEDSYVPRTVARGESKDVLPMGKKDLFDAEASSGPYRTQPRLAPEPRAAARADVRLGRPADPPDVEATVASPSAPLHPCHGVNETRDLSYRSRSHSVEQRVRPMRLGRTKSLRSSKSAPQCWESSTPALVSASAGPVGRFERRRTVGPVGFEPTSSRLSAGLV